MTTVQMLLLKNLMEPLLMVKKSKLTVPEVVEVAAIEEAAVADMAETAMEATVAAEAAEAMVEAVGVAAAMAETATEAMEVAMIRDPIKFLGYDRKKNTVKPCNGWPTS